MEWWSAGVMESWTDQHSSAGSLHSQIQFQVHGAADWIVTIRVNAFETERLVQADGFAHRRHRVQAHPLVTSPASLFDDGQRQLSPQALAAKGRPHIKPLHLA